MTVKQYICHCFKQCSYNFALLVLSAVLVGAGCKDNATSPEDPEKEGIETLRQATDRYHDVEVAINEGFVQADPCVENQEGSGAIGIPYVNMERKPGRHHQLLAHRCIV